MVSLVVAVVVVIVNVVSDTMLLLLLLMLKTLYILWRSFIIPYKHLESCRLVLLLFIVDVVTDDVVVAVDVVTDDVVVVVVVVVDVIAYIAYVKDITYIMEKFYNT